VKEFDKICADIKSLRIQGATNVAKAGVRAYLLKPSKSSRKKIISLRPTEPALFNALNFLEKGYTKKEIFSHFESSQKKINQFVSGLIRKNSTIYTHCHSSSVIKALIAAKENGKSFSVVLTETRPLYQGRKTARELANKKIKVSFYSDSAMHEAVEKADMVLIGADAILRKGIINKIGSEAISEIANVHGIPVYVVSDFWKFYPKTVDIEQRNFNEVWKEAPKSVKVRNPAFEVVPSKYIRRIVSEFGILTYSEFIKKADNLI